MVKRARIARLSRPAVAMALFTLQTYAPGGGAGHRVGLRGGGPLTTLVVPDGTEGRVPLWHLVWTHMVQLDPEQSSKPADLATLSKVLPWLAPTPPRRRANGAGRRHGAIARVLGHAASHPARLRAAQGEPSLRSDRRGGHRDGRQVPRTPARVVLRRLAAAASVVAALSAEDDAALAAFARPADRDRLSRLGRSGPVGCRRHARSCCGGQACPRAVADDRGRGAAPAAVTTWTT